MSWISVDARHLHAAQLHPPVSKSDALRALVLADITGLPLPALGESLPTDVEALTLGLAVLRERSDEIIDCGDGAAPFRILLGQAAIRPGTSRLKGSARLAERPHGPLVEALRIPLQGLRIIQGAPWPWLVQGTQAVGNRTFIAPTGSSQFATSLLLAAARRAFEESEGWCVELPSEANSAGYLDLTLHWLARTGFQLQRSNQEVLLRRGGTVTLPVIPVDWSSAGYLLAVAWRSGGEVLGLDWKAVHPDRAMLRILEEAGLAVARSPSGATTVRGVPLRGIKATARECPDLIPTLAALACALPDVSCFEEIDLLRHKESDRVEGILDLLRQLGARATLKGARLEVSPLTRPPAQFRISGRGDHRLVMAAATAAVLFGIQVEIEGPEVVGKSFPGFFEELSRSGAIVC